MNILRIYLKNRTTVKLDTLRSTIIFSIVTVALLYVPLSLSYNKYVGGSFFNNPYLSLFIGLLLCLCIYSISMKRVYEIYRFLRARRWLGIVLLTWFTAILFTPAIQGTFTKSMIYMVAPFLSVIFGYIYAPTSKVHLTRLYRACKVLFGTIFIVGILQYFSLLTKLFNILGYGPETILPIQTVNSNAANVRAIGFLRGANSFGVLAASTFAGLIHKITKKINRTQLDYFLIGLCVISVVLSKSRSALLGALSLLAIYFFTHKNISRLFKLATVLATSGLFIILINIPSVHEFVYHSKQGQSVDSNSQRFDSVSSALKDIIKRPLGYGIGSAGPLSRLRQDGKEPRIIENQFLQTAYEIGVLSACAYYFMLGYIIYTVYRHSSHGKSATYSTLPLLIGCAFLPLMHEEVFLVLPWIFLGISGNASHSNR